MSSACTLEGARRGRHTTSAFYISTRQPTSASVHRPAGTRLFPRAPGTAHRSMHARRPPVQMWQQAHHVFHTLASPLLGTLACPGTTLQQQQSPKQPECLISKSLHTVLCSSPAILQPRRDQAQANRMQTVRRVWQRHSQAAAAGHRGCPSQADDLHLTPPHTVHRGTHAQDQLLRLQHAASVLTWF